MPVIKKGIRRPWMPAPKKPHEGRIRPNTKFYQSVAWRKLREEQLKLYPLCAECEKAGKYTPATVADHIVPINQGGAPLSLENLQSLCNTCHNRKSARESRNGRI